jgi:hypothetical protein
VILQVLVRYYGHDGETQAELETLARTAKHLMNWVMRELCPALTSLPIGPSHPGRTAGPDPRGRQAGVLRAAPTVRPPGASSTSALSS